ncbi:MAG: hypothetical protein GY811_01755 [Myxococcales bacterium]|nr:hypothetical protein [Myxococcales bacterium]
MGNREDTKTGYPFVVQDDTLDSQDDSVTPRQEPKLIEDSKALTQEIAPMLGTIIGGRYREENSMKMELAHVRSPIPSALERSPQLPEGIDDFFAAAIAKDPEHRPQHMLDLARLLRECLGDKRRP